MHTLALLFRCCPQSLLLAFSEKLQLCVSLDRVPERRKVVEVVGVSVSPGSHNKYHRLAVKQQTFISDSSGGWESKVRKLADSVSGEGLLTGLQMVICPCFFL